MTTTQSSQGGNWLLGLILPIAIVAGGVALLNFLGTQEAKKINDDPDNQLVQLVKMPIVSLDTVRPFDGIETLDVQVSGTVVPFRQITLGSEISGRVIFKSEECRIGRYVHQGDVLFRIDPTDYQLDLERLTALRESEYAQQHELDQELANANRSLSLANEELTLQEKELQRLESLGSGFVSEAEISQTKRARIMAANQVVTVQNQVRMLETRRTRIELAERLASAQLAQAKANLERTEVKAPISGVIVSESVQNDSYVQKGATLCMIEDTERVEVSCSLRTDQLLLILDQEAAATRSDASSRVVRSSSYELPKTPVEISYRVADRNDVVYRWNGHLSRYEGIGLDTQSRTVPIRITVDNPRDVRRNNEAITEDGNGGLPALVRGMFVDVAIKTRPTQPLALVPKLALKPGGQVWRFEPAPDMLKSIQPGEEGKPEKEIDETQVLIKPSEWDCGYLKIVNGVNAISLIRLGDSTQSEYWVVEAMKELPPGTPTIVSPVANIIGDGNDRVRIPATGNR